MNDPTKIYSVWFRSHKLWSEDESELIGIFNDKNFAVQVGRKCITHKEDEYYVCEHTLNEQTTCLGIWNSFCDKNPDDRLFYKEYWKEGFPK